MSNDLNSINIIGRLVREPETKQLQSGKSLCSFSIASSRSYSTNGEKREDTVFADVVAWGKLGEIVQKYASKGKQVCIRGRLKQDTWQGPDGKNRSKISIVAEDVQLLGSKNETQNNPTYGNTTTVDNNGFGNREASNQELDYSSYPEDEPVPF